MLFRMTAFRELSQHGKKLFSAIESLIILENSINNETR